MSQQAGVVVVGGGQAGFQLVQSLRHQGYDGSVTLIAEEAYLPYQRPPLSKAFLKGLVTAEDLPFAANDFYQDNRVEIITGRVSSIDPGGKRVTLDDARSLGYDHLVLATGARNRRFPGLEETKGLVSLRTVTDALELHERLSADGTIVIIGAGFLGLEVASVCADAGARVVVVETMARVMNRSSSPAISRLFQDRLQAQGVTFHLGAREVRVLRENGHVSEVAWEGGQVSTKLALASIGVVPNLELARDAGMPVANGILVDAQLATAAPDVYAIGDCAAFPSRHYGQTVRLESVQNAVDHAHCVAASITGDRQPYTSLPWFWSEQAGLKLQIAGKASAQSHEIIVHGQAGADDLSAYHFENDLLVGVESVNRPKDHMRARKLLRSDEVTSAAAVREMLASVA